MSAFFAFLTGPANHGKLGATINASMKHRSLGIFLVCSLFLAQAGLALPARAAGWVEVDSPTSDTLFGVALSDDAIYAVGEDGTVLYSDDDGDTWNDGDSDVSVDLYDVAAISSTRAVAVGASGAVIRTTDGGDSWNEIEPTLDASARADYDLRAVTMASSSVGYAVGQYGIAIKTTNGGSSWTEITEPTGSLDRGLNSVATSGTSTVWVAGEGGVIYKSTNAGTSWTAQSSGTGENIVTIAFSDSSNGWASGDSGTFLRTTDGGSDWDAVEIPELESDETIEDISFWNDDDGILAGSDGTLLITDDGGDSWDDVDGSASEVLIDLSAVSASEWWAVGVDGIILRADAGAPSKPADFDVEGDNSEVSDTTPTFTWDASEDDEGDIDYYALRIDSGSYTNTGADTTYTPTSSLSSGSHTAYLYAVDDGGNVSTVATLSFTVDPDSTSGDAPDVSTVTPTTAVRDTSITISSRISSDGSDIESCDLYVDDENDKSMTVQDDVAYTTRTFTENGTYDVYVRCTDEDGERTSGSETTITVSSGSSHAEPGDIIKMACTGDVYVNDPCTAVYYYGVDGKRHAFPNEAAFTTWFTDFDDLVVLSSAAMADITLGRNVTYRPGVKLVQFSTSAVYAVSYNGILRPIANGEIAEAIFGSDWTSEIAGVNDVFYGNYRIGSTIDSSNDFSASTVKSASRTIDVTF